jgi:hypothetical protein
MNVSPSLVLFFMMCIVHAGHERIQQDRTWNTDISSAWELYSVGESRNGNSNGNIDSVVSLDRMPGEQDPAGSPSPKGTDAALRCTEV